MPGHLKKTTPYLYADDTQNPSSSYDFETLAQNLNDDLNNILAFKNKLQHHPTKTKVLFIASSYNSSIKLEIRQY
jgi:hypothetical protein